jgi:hypothetical protein
MTGELRYVSIFTFFINLRLKMLENGWVDIAGCHAW